MPSHYLRHTATPAVNISLFFSYELFIVTPTYPSAAKLLLLLFCCLSSQKTGKCCLIKTGKMWNICQNLITSLGLDYKTERALLKHYFKDHGTVPSVLENTKKYICSQCPNIYTKKTSFDAHMRTKHTDTPKKYVKSQFQALCPYCEKKFVTNRRTNGSLRKPFHKSKKFS